MMNKINKYFCQDVQQFITENMSIPTVYTPSFHLSIRLYVNWIQYTEVLNRNQNILFIEVANIFCIHGLRTLSLLVT